jgi:tetratricopeptide (TPR) repeat protein
VNEHLSRVVAHARRHGVVVLAGAGVSSGPPSSLPSWKPLNEAILRALSMRAESLKGRPGWLARVLAPVNQQREQDHFPPEYQAQLIHEVCGERYFRALQALDLDVINEGHDTIAALASSGFVRAIVTTNFDPLIERALDRRGLSYTAAFNEAGFTAVAERMPDDGPDRALPIIKIHGCVSDHLSMIDTLKQRRLGRSAKLQACLDNLHEHFWIYVGFSAADLEGDEHYLGLCKGAQRSPGALYVQWPGNSPKQERELSKGAATLMSAYHERGSVVVADVGVVLGKLCSALGGSALAPPLSSDPIGSGQVERGLRRWADGLAPASAVLSLGAVLEAVGDAEAAVRVLDRFVRHELVGSEREGPDFRALQLHYGRMGAALGRFIAVPDLNGFSSNASVETVESLRRLAGSELEFIALGHVATAWLWLGNGAESVQAALKLAASAEHHAAWGAAETVQEAPWALPRPRAPEDAVDGFVSAAQVATVGGEPNFVRFLARKSAAVVELARRCGDPIRAARAAASLLLLLSETEVDVAAVARSHESDFDEAVRVGDGFSLALRALALGRWLVGPGGLGLVRKGAHSNVGVADAALRQLRAANLLLQRQGMDPWIVYSQIQQAKALFDLGRFDEAQATMDMVAPGVERFPIWRSHALEATAQALFMQGADEQAKGIFQAAANAARAIGLPARAELIKSYLLVERGKPD